MNNFNHVHQVLYRLSFAVLMVGMVSIAVSAQEEQHEIRGRVTDHLNHPVSRVQVFLRDLQSGKTLQTTSDRQGRFELFHPATAACTLEVSPGLDSGLCSAILENIPGNQARHISVQLPHGFLVTGRIVDSGKGLKGLSIKVLPSESGSSPKDMVHGGGIATTGGDGNFRLILTPGHKNMLVSNTRYSRLPTQINHAFTVTGDTKLPDLVLSN